MIRVIVSDAPLEIGVEHERLEQGGAIATFTGLVRPDAEANGSVVDELLLEHYPGATEAALTRLAEAGVARWELTAVTIVHRIGAMRPGDRIVFIGTCAPHRAAALEACAYLIDRLKTDAPFWKRERRGADATWVEQRAGDRLATKRWSIDRGR